MEDKSLIFGLFAKFLEESDEENGGLKERENRNAQEPEQKAQEHDDRVETAEDWNELEERRRQQAEAELLDEDSPDTEEHTEAPMEAVREEYRDASAEIIVADDKMSVSMILTEPAGGGSHITEEAVLDALEARHIRYGIDREKITAVTKGRQYRQMFVIANGTPAADGENGKIKDYFPRQKQLKFASKGNGEVDFKNMNLIHNVKKGELVCELTMPKEPQDGTDVFGNPVRGKMGTMPPIPQGRNIVYSPEKDKLLTACEGNLTFRNGRFQVENVYVVDGNVDNSVGNIDFMGSVTIKGDVFEGFKVTSKGDITVMGMVEGAVLKAGGSILLQKGMRGMKSGVLEAGENITAKFLEDCTLYAKKNIQAEYIINSEVSCGNDLTLIGKRGALIGGNCSVYNQMKVRVVGSTSHVATFVTLGITPQLMEEMERIGKDLIAVSRKLQEDQKDIRYLSDKKRAGTITPKQQERLQKLQLGAPVNALKEKKLKEQAAVIARQLREVGRTRLTAGEVHPGTVITIGDCKLNIVKKEISCSFYYLDGEIRKGIR